MVLLSAGSRCLAEASCDLVKRPAPGLRHFEVGEDEEEDQQDSEDDEDVGATHLLWRGTRGETTV